LNMLSRIQRSLSIRKLTKNYIRAKQVPQHGCTYYINKLSRVVEGDHALSMLLDISVNDTYGLKRFESLESIIDIGANIGIFSLHAASLFPKANILAYEPADQARPYLKKNCEGLNITVFPYAVSNKSGEANLNLDGDLTACYISQTGDENYGSESSNSLANDITNHAGRSQKCVLITLDEIAKKFEYPISLLKLDCEGSEYDILKSSSLSKFREIVGEFHDCPNGNPDIGLSLLRESGFEINKWDLFPDGKAGIVWASNKRCSKMK
ncbi:MAG: FkbM family methyltransferase, partial [Phormidesmis sp.]